MKMVEQPPVTCSFCRRTSHDTGVDVMVTLQDHSAAICGECVEIARDILGFVRHGHAVETVAHPALPTAPFKVVTSGNGRQQ
ncbi:MAG TPA: ClpX C4-type zinc finger protein [Burkholderiaceae bacterium]|nr:ClpX C4-type zinc finger protein [Burkholderiaceae bacterium]